MIVAAVPVKDLAAAKQRLVGVLTPGERAALARAMLADVLGALRQARLDAVWVVTRDAGAAALARALDAEVLDEPTSQGHTAAVALAQARAVARGVRVFLTVPGDVPRVEAAEVRALAAATVSPPAAAFVASRSGLGTNGVALAPPDGMPLRFGEPSFPDHVVAARARGLEPRVLALPGLALDIDTPADLLALADEPAASKAGWLLRAWRIAERVRDAGERAPRAAAPRGAAVAPSE